MKNCDICNDLIPFPGMAVRYTLAQFRTLADGLVSQPDTTVGALRTQVDKGRFRTESGPPFANLQMGTRLAAADWILCSTCDLAVTQVLAADRSLGSMVGAPRTGW